MNRDQRPKTKDQRPKRILIVRLDKIGDVLLSTPVIKNLRDAYPDSHIAFMVTPYARQIVEGNPYLDEVIVYDKSGSCETVLGNIRFAMKLGAMRFDLALILHPTNRSHMLIFLAGIPQRIGYDRKMEFLLTRKIPHTKQFGLKHEIDYTLDLLRYIGIEPKDKTLYMPTDQVSERRIDKLFKENGISAGDKVVILNPGASCPSKIWPAQNFAEAASMLSNGHGAKIVVIAGSNDKRHGDRVASLVKGGCLNLSGSTTISDIASVLRRSKLFISNDSGPVHIACAVGTPVVDIFGRNDAGLSPRRWGPSGKSDVVLHKDVGCDFCLAHNCKIGFKCLEAVTVDEVVMAAKGILK